MGNTLKAWDNADFRIMIDCDLKRCADYLRNRARHDRPLNDDFPEIRHAIGKEILSNARNIDATVFNHYDERLKQDAERISKIIKSKQLSINRTSSCKTQQDPDKKFEQF